jgi:hypothetical protein
MTPKSYSVLGWFFFTFGLLVFLYWAYRDQKTPTGSIQTFVWTAGGAILLYVMAGLYAFTNTRILPQSDGFVPRHL